MEFDDVSVTAVSTSFPFTESFNAPGPELPFFWTTQNEGVGIVDGWIVDPSNNAGGTVGEVVWNWQDVSSGTTRLIYGAQHPGPIDTRDQFQAVYASLVSVGGGTDEEIQTSTNGADWTDELWSVTLTDEFIGPETTYAYITHNLNSASTFVSFVITGDLRQIASWIIDDVLIVSNGTPGRVDFDADGQEDILWRYQGAGAYQGLNVIWLMNQSGTASPVPISASPSAKELLQRGRGDQVIHGPGQAGGDTDPCGRAGSTGEHEVGVGGSLDVDLKPSQIMRDPLERRDDRTPSKGYRPGTARLNQDHPAEGRGVAPATLNSGGAKIAALQTETELVFSQITDLDWEYRLEPGDFDGDGNTDILWRNYTGRGPTRG